MIGDVVIKYPSGAVEKVASKYSLSFKYEQGECRLFYQDGKAALECPEDAAPDFLALITGVTQLEQQTAKLSGLDAAKFLRSYTDMHARFLTELSKHAVYETVNAQPIDLGAMSDEQRALLELLAEQMEVSERTGSDKIVISQEMLNQRTNQRIKR